MNFAKVEGKILINLDKVEKIVLESKKLTFYFEKNKYKQIVYKNKKEAKEELAKISKEFGFCNFYQKKNKKDL